MQWQKTAVAVVPCLDEAATIKEVVRQIRRVLPAVIVVDDGSQDSTTALAAAAGARVLRHPHNRGKGAAIRTGLSAALETGYEWAVLLDGDGQHRPADIALLLERAQSTGAQLVIGNRLLEPSTFSPVRRFVNRWMSREISRLAGQPLPDTQSGFRLLQLEAWHPLALKADHFEVESEMVLAFAQRGYRIEFVPIRSLPRVRGSHIRPLVDTWRWFKWRFGASRSDDRQQVSSMPQTKSSAACR